MVDTPRALATLQGLFADNTSGDISPQDLRDFLVSVMAGSPLAVDVTNSRVGIGTAAPAVAFEVAEETPASTGAALARFMAGSVADPIVSAKQGVIIQLYSDDWIDGDTYSALNVHQRVPAGSDYFPWALSSVVRSSASAGTAEHVAGFFRAEGGGGSPMWAGNFIASDRRSDDLSQAAASLVSAEFSVDKFATGSTGVGLDILARGDEAVGPDRAIHIRKDTVYGSIGDWLFGIVIQDSAVPIKTTGANIQWDMYEVGASAPDGRIQFLLDSANFRMDISTSGEYAARRTPLLINTGATGGDVYIGGSDQAGTSPVIFAGRGDGTAKLAFFGATKAARPTGVAVTAAGVHAALVTLGLITA